MRMRKKKWTAPYLETREDVMVFHPEEYKGNWRDVVKGNVLHVEIGSGKGDYWLGMSKLYPEEAWVGVEKVVDVAGIAVRKSEGQVSENMKFVNQDAEDLTLWFAPKEIDVIHLNFSDPWPKKRNAKRRLTHAGFLARYEEVLSDDGKIVMKTDNSGLFEYSLVSFAQYGFILDEVSVDFRRVEHPEDVITEYERNFMDKGQPIYRAIWKKGGKVCSEE